MVGVFTLAGCGGGKGSSNDDCGEAGPCPGGFICIDDECVQLCISDSDCIDASTICVDDGVCQPGTRTDQPVITGIEGDGPVDADPDHTDHHIRRFLTITGEHLDGVDVKLTDSSNHYEWLDVCQTGSTQIEVALPDNIQEGVHVLTVATQAGACDSTLPVLEGTPGTDGPAGSPDTAAEVLAKLLQVDGASSGLDADTLDGVELSTLLDQLVPVGTVVPFAGTTIPEGWLLCDGAEVSRTDYADLYAAIGVVHGGGDLVSTFHLPDLRGRFVRGADMGAGRDPDAASRAAPAAGGGSGDAVGSIQDDQFQTHIHQARSFQRTGSSDQLNTSNSNFTNVWSDTTEPTSGRHGTETRPRNIYLSYIIKY